MAAVAGAGEGAAGVPSRLLLTGAAEEAAPELSTSPDWPSGRPLSGSRASSLNILNMSEMAGGWHEGCHRSNGRWRAASSSSSLLRASVDVPGDVRRA